MPDWDAQEGHRIRIEDGVVRSIHRGGTCGAGSGCKGVECGVDCGGGDLRKVLLAPVAKDRRRGAEEGVEEPLGVARWQRVLRPQQHVEAAVDTVALHEVAIVVDPNGGLDAQGNVARLDQGGHSHEVRPERVVDDIERQLHAGLLADAVGAEYPSNLVEQGRSLGRVGWQHGP